MRSLVSRSIILGSCLVTGVVWSGCEAKQVTEYVTGISTQVTVPRDLKAIRVDVRVGGVSQFCHGYRVYDGKVQLPRSLGTFAATDGAIVGGPITYTIAGIMSDDVDGHQLLSCNTLEATVKSDQVRILRRSRQPYIRDEILFLPMPLKYSCYDKQCDDVDGVEMTCKGGKCVPATLTDPEIAALPKYTPDLVDGTGATCFSNALCMTPPLPAMLVDPTNCTYAVPNTPSAPPPVPGVPSLISGPSTGEGVNVEITWDGGLVHEVLDGDPQEGFFIPDPVQFPQRFRLTEGLCEMVKGKDAQGNPTPHRITAVRTNGRCQPKKLAQPLCAADQLAAMGLEPGGVIPQPAPSPVCGTAELKPPPTAMVVVVDNTQAHTKFFEGLKKTAIDPNDEESAVGPVLRALLSDPIFQSTDIGLVYAPGGNACNPTAALDIGLGLTDVQREPILTDLNAKGNALLPPPAIPSYEGALARAYNALATSPKDYFRRAVIVLGNNGFDGADCGTPGGARQRAADANAAAKPTKTYVMQLTRDPGPKQVAADQLAESGGTPPSAYRTSEARTKFTDIVNSLATCIYEVPDDTSKPVEGDVVSFTDPITPGALPVKASFNPACNGENVGGQGWGYSPTAPANKKHIHLCQETCNAYRNILQTTAVFSASIGQPSIAVPLYAYKTVCTQ
jgi:hypothetical protein